MSEVVINTLVYLDELNANALQSELIKKIKTAGGDSAEIRREFIHNFDSELPAIKRVSEEQGLHLFYSVPDEIFKKGKVNPRLKSYLDEASKMGIYAIKFNIGDFANFKGDLVKELSFLSDSPIQVNVENDQTEISGTKNAITDFLAVVAANELDIRYVYDLGNWRFVGEDELQAAKELAQYTRYIHLKDVAIIDGKSQVVPLDQGDINWRQVLSLLPGLLPVAIEYPVKNTQVLIDGIKLVKNEL